MAPMRIGTPVKRVPISIAVCAAVIIRRVSVVDDVVTSVDVIVRRVSVVTIDDVVTRVDVVAEIFADATASIDDADRRGTAGGSGTAASGSGNAGRSGCAGRSGSASGSVRKALETRRSSIAGRLCRSLRKL